MDRQTLLVVVLGVCILNGLFSPFLVVFIPVTAVLMPELFPKTQEWVLFFSSVFLSSATLFFSGVPAALYERFADRNSESVIAMYIWLAVALALTIPAFGTLSRL